MNRTLIFGAVLLAGLAGAALMLQPRHSTGGDAVSNGATTVKLVKLPASTGGVSVGLTKLPPGGGR